MARIVLQEWFTAAQLAEMVLPGLPTTKVGMLAMAKREGWALTSSDEGSPLSRPRKGRGGGMEFHISLLPDAAQAGLMAKTVARHAPERPDRDSIWARYDRLPDGMKQEAMRRLRILTEIEDLQRAGLGKEKALQMVVGQARRVALAAKEAAPFCDSTVRGWFARIHGVDASDRLAYLAPDYCGRTAKVGVTQEAVEYYAADFLRLALPTHAACYRRLIRAASDKGWIVPSAKTLMRRVDADYSQDVQLYLRMGEKALSHAYPHMDRSRAGIGLLQIVNLDGHICDNNVVWPDGEKGRPVCVAVQDIASSHILAIRFGKTLTQHLVRMALADVFRDHGIPGVVLMDNGRENTAASISGGYQRLRVTRVTREFEPPGLLMALGIQATFAQPYWGQAKPIERFFRDLAGDIAKHPAFEGSYTGKNTVSKPDYPTKVYVPIAEYEAIIRAELVHYNAQEGRTGAHMEGRSFDQVYAALAALKPPRRATSEQLRIALLTSKPVTMHQTDHSVRVADHRYWSKELRAIKRQQVIVRYDPDNLASPVYVYSLENRFLCEAPRTGVGSFDRAQDGQAHGKLRRDYQNATRAVAKADRRLTAAEAAAGLPTHRPAPPEINTAPNVVHAAFGVARTAEQVAQAEFNAAQDRSLSVLFGS